MRFSFDQAIKNLGVFSVVLILASLILIQPVVAIENLHQVTHTKGQLIRGAAPKNSDIAELKNLGVNRVVIIKKETRGEVQKEVAALKAAGFSESKINVFPITWTEETPMLENCKMIVQSLALIKASLDKGENVYVHCTAGEDRTGLVSGIIRQLVDSWSAEKAFSDELCARGYEAGDSGKPAQVVNKIRQNLTPIYVKLSQAVAAGQMTGSNINPSICGTAFNQNSAISTKKFVCK